MKKFFEKMAWFINGLSTVTGWAAAICIVAAAFIVTEGVLVRKLLGVSTIWQIEASVFLLIFAVFVGAPFVQKSEHHLNVDLVLIHLSPRVRAITLIVVSILTLLLTVCIAWFAWPMWWDGLKSNEHSASLWGPPMWIPHLFLPLGMTLLFLQYIVYIGEKIQALMSGDLDHEMERSELKGVEIPEADKSGQELTGDPSEAGTSE